ncbi:nitrite reductase small subunit NirD [Kitasatospora sp. NPDC049258]|uniref:nitrite reductase small subunit NirD n=1 Tax=Kitasatospora sp. NPDC049258 TaxID=3155394 RepID=UPI003428771F
MTTTLEPPGTAATTDTARVELLAGADWTAVCDWSRLTPGRGVAVLLPDGRQAAVFRDSRDAVYAIANQDPFTGAYVLSRGLLGATADGRVYVASPLLKQRFDLSTGECLEDSGVRVAVHPARVARAGVRRR